MFQLLSLSVPILHEFPLSKEDENAALSEGDNEEFSVPSSLVYIIYENRMYFYENFVSFFLHLAEDNEVLGTYVSANFGSVKEKNALKQIIKLFA